MNALRRRPCGLREPGGKKEENCASRHYPPNCYDFVARRPARQTGGFGTVHAFMPRRPASRIGLARRSQLATLKPCRGP
jgi:hypothetical protein